MKLLKSGHNYLAKSKRNDQNDYSFALVSREKATRFTDEEATVIAKFLNVKIVEEIPSYVICRGQAYLYRLVGSLSVEFFLAKKKEIDGTTDAELVWFESIEKAHAFQGFLLEAGGETVVQYTTVVEASL